MSTQKRRSKIAKILLNYGNRVQKSVFEMVVEESYYRECLGQLKQFVTSEDTIRIYKISHSNAQTTVLLGGAQKIESNPLFLII